jgi:hypothetical protein
MLCNGNRLLGSFGMSKINSRGAELRSATWRLGT